MSPRPLKPLKSESSKHRVARRRSLLASFGLSTALHAAGLVALPILLGWGFFAVKNQGAGGPADEVQITFFSSPLTQGAAQVESAPDEPVEEPIAVPEDDWSDWIEPFAAEASASWRSSSLLAEAAFEAPPVDAPVMNFSTRSSLGIQPNAQPGALEAKALLPSDRVEEGAAQNPAVDPDQVPVQEPPREVDEPHAGEPVTVEWTPELWAEHCPQPKFPTKAQRRKWQGKVLLLLTVGVDGHVDSVEILQGSGYAVLDDAAKKGLGKWRFRPAPQGAHSSQVKRWVDFRLPD